MYGGDLDKYMGLENNLIPYSEDNLQFYEDLKREGLTADRDEPVYKIYHLFGTHPQISMNENLETVATADTSEVKVARGCFKIIGEYLEQLKAQGLYDSTSILIMADHGMSLYRQCPTVMIKEENVRREQMLVNSAPVSYLSDWKDTILSLITGEDRDQSMLNIEEDEERERTYYFYILVTEGWDRNYLPNIYELKFTGKTNEIDGDECFTGRIYAKPHERKPYRYHLGDTIGPDDSAFFSDAVQYGIRPFFWGLSSMEKEAKFEVYLDKLPKRDVQLCIDLYEETYNEASFEQTVEVFVNGSSVGKEYILMDDQVSFIIPKQLIDDEHMTIEFKAETDAHYESHLEKISLVFSAIQMKEINASAENKELPLLDEDLTVPLKQGVKEKRIRIRGVWPAETEATWSWKKSQYIFNAHSEGDMLFKLQSSPFLENEEVIVSFNGHEIKRFNQAAGFTTLEAVLPKEDFNEQGYQTVEIYIPQATSPALMGESVDGRTLGLYMQEISLSFLEDPTKASAKSDEQKPYRYHLGDTINAEDSAFFLDAVRYGMRSFDPGLASMEKEARFEVYLDKQPKKDVQLCIGLCKEVRNQLNFEQTVEVFANGSSVGKEYILMDDQVSFIIPKRLIDDKHVTVELKAETDAHYEGHPERVSLVFSAIQMKEIEASAATEELPLLGEDLTVPLKQGVSEERVRIRGVWPAETEATWSWKKSQYIFNAHSEGDMLFKLQSSPFLENEEVIVSFNGHEIKRFNQAAGFTTLEAVLPKEDFNEQGYQTVEIYIPQATSPALTGESVDGRVLGLYMQEISLSFLEDSPQTP